MKSHAAAHWSPEEIETVRRLAARGFDDEEIGQRLGRGRGAIVALRKRHWIKKAEPARAPIEAVDNRPSHVPANANDANFVKLLLAAFPHGFGEVRSVANSQFKRLPPPTLTSNGRAMT